MNYCDKHPRGLGLDETGNWSGFKQSNGGATWSLEQTRTANTVNELTAINASIVEQWANPKYDANGNMTSIPRPGLSRPSWANLTTDQWSALTVDDWARMEVAPKFQATYDALNRLVKLTEPGATTTDPVQENQYDGRGYRIVSKSYTAGTLTETRHAYFTDQWQCLEERLGTSTTSDRQFIWGVRYIDDLILRDRSVSGGTLNERLYALQDANWNVTTVTDSTGTIQERYEYEPYGVTTVLAPDFTLRTTSNFAWETTYCGYRWDQSTGLFAVRHRFYHPRLGTWLARDPIGYSGRAAHLYEYVSSEPVTLLDPSGNEELDLTISFVEDSVTATAALAVGPNFEITPTGNACAGLGMPAKKFGKGKNKKGKKNDDGKKGKDKKAKGKWKWAEAKTKLLELVAGGQNCIRSVTFTGHGWNGSAATFDVNTVQQSSGSEEADFLDILKKNRCKGKCTILLNHCKSANLQVGKDFIQMFADETGYTVDGFTDIYAVMPHGDRYSATPGGAAPVNVGSFPAYDGDCSLQNISDSLDWLWGGTVK